jgi:hypothetical protein
MVDPFSAASNDENAARQRGLWRINCRDCSKTAGKICQAVTWRIEFVYFAKSRRSTSSSDRRDPAPKLRHKLMAKAGVPGMQKYFATGDFPICFGISSNDFYKELDLSLTADSATVKEQVLRRNPALACRDPKTKAEYPVLCKPRTQ